MLSGVEGDDEEIEEEGDEDGANTEDYLKAQQAKLEEEKKALLDNQNIMAEVSNPCGAVGHHLVNQHQAWFVRERFTSVRY